MKKAVASDGKARAEAERCRKMSNQAIKEHATMKEQYTMNVTKLKWLENKLQVESEALGKLVTSEITRFKIYCYDKSHTDIHMISHFVLYRVIQSFSFFSFGKREKC